MKKNIIVTLLIIMLFAGLHSVIGFAGYGNQVYAKGVTTSKNCLSQPKVKVQKRTANAVTLKINKVKGATTYRIYRADSKNGKYTCIGKTKENVFIDKIKNNKNCYYKVKAVTKINNVTITSKRSKAVPAVEKKTTTVNPAEKPITNPAVNTVTNSTPSVPVKTENKETVTNTSSNQSYADEVLKLVNQERAKAGLKALTTTSSLQNAANKRATEIVKSFSHTRPDGRSFSTVLNEYSISYRAAGENIAMGQRTPQEVMNGWMNSSGHRANILGSQFGKVGIGVYKAADGRYYWTQVFTD